MGVLRRILDAAIQLRGQFVYVNGEKAAEIDLALPADVPFGFVASRSTRPSGFCATNSRRSACAVERGVRSPASSRTPTG